MQSKSSGQGMQDKEILQDTLSSQKGATVHFNLAANECAMPALREEMIRILNEEHQMQANVFTEMQQRGWYPTPLAPEQKVQCTKEKFQTQG